MQYKGLITGLLFSALLSSAAQAEQRCKEYRPATAPTKSFKIDLKRNVVTKDGLMWKRCAEGQRIDARKGCEGKADQIYLPDALSKPKYKKFAGYGDWRMPTIEEVKGILEKRCKKPAFNLDVFPEAPNLKLWSSDLVEGDSEKAWIMFSSTGVAVKHRTSLPAMLRLVRDIK